MPWNGSGNVSASPRRPHPSAIYAFFTSARVAGARRSRRPYGGCGLLAVAGRSEQENDGNHRRSEHLRPADPARGRRRHRRHRAGGGTGGAREDRGEDRPHPPPRRLLGPPRRRDVPRPVRHPRPRAALSRIRPRARRRPRAPQRLGVSSSTSSTATGRGTTRPAIRCRRGPASPRTLLRVGRVRPKRSAPAWGALRDLPRVACPHLDVRTADTPDRRARSRRALGLEPRPRADPRSLGAPAQRRRGAAHRPHGARGGLRDGAAPRPRRLPRRRPPATCSGPG